MDVKLKDNQRALARRVDEMAAQLRKEDPCILATKAGARYFSMGAAQGMLTLPLWGRLTALTFPHLDAMDAQTKKALPLYMHALVMHYLCTTDGMPIQGSWISFSELPEGRFYSRAFEGYTGERLAGKFKQGYDSFVRAAESIGGKQESFASHAYSFEALPRVPLLAACWCGDEEFSPSYRVLFDSSVSHHLSTDACAIIGSALTRRLENALRSNPQ